jgi:hypothetical protein
MNMALTYVRCENGKPAFQVHFTDEYIAVAKAFLINLFETSLFTDKNVNVLLEDNAFLEFMVFFNENKQSEEDMQKWVEDAYAFYLVDFEQEVANKFVMALPDLEMPNENEVSSINTMELVMEIPEVKPAEEVAQKPLNTSESYKRALMAAIPNHNHGVQPTQTSAPTPHESEVDWSDVGKTIGVFAAGIAVGVGAKWTYDHFFG